MLQFLGISVHEKVIGFFLNNNTRFYFEQIAHKWDEPTADRLLDLQRLFQRMDRFLPLSGTLLEVGTGTGALITLLHQFRPNASLVSLDLAFNMLHRARQREARACLVQGDVLDLPFSTSDFGSVICHNSFPHFSDHPAALQELQRVVRSGGHVIVAHDIGRERVNSIHMHTHADFLHHHILPSGEVMTNLFVQVGLTPLQMEDETEYYLACAVK